MKINYHYICSCGKCEGHETKLKNGSAALYDALNDRRCCRSGTVTRISDGKARKVFNNTVWEKDTTSGYYYDNVRSKLLAATKVPRSEQSDSLMIRTLLKIVCDLADDLGVRVEYQVKN